MSKLSLAEQFFYDHAGGSYIPKLETKRAGRLRCARALATAESRIRSAGWSYTWVPDEDPDLSWCDVCEHMRQCRHRYGCTHKLHSSSHGHEVYGCILSDDTGREREALWGITDPDANYRRVVEAELALEALPDVDAEIRTSYAAGIRDAGGAA